MAATSQDEFVDLYEVLELPTDAESETIRQRLNTLYLEAQQNLDHRNAKKRLQYQQMYEIYLPQARHLLMDPRRRGEYDVYLNAYRTGNKVVATDSATDGGTPPPPPSDITKEDEPPLPGMAEVEVDPEVLAAQREDIWAKWKQGLQLVSEDEPAAPSPLPGAEPVAAQANAAGAEEASAAAAGTRTAPTPPLPPFARTGPPVPRTAGGRPAPPAPRNPGTAPVRPTPPAPRTPQIGRPGTASVAAAQAEQQQIQEDTENERRREQQRYALIKDSVQNAGLMWGGIYAGTIFAVGCILLFVLDGYLKPNYFLGLTQTSFAALGFFLILLLTAVGGLLARRKAKRRAVGDLSLLTLEELMRRQRG